jgi:hypothetical protein
MKKVYTAQSTPDAGIVRNLLEENGIPTQLVERTFGAFGAPRSEVWVNRNEDQDRAAVLIDRFFARQESRSAWNCRKCREDNPPAFDVCWQCGVERP